MEVYHLTGSKARESRAVYAGSFDPVTFGHLWMIKQGWRMFSSLTVAVGVNPEKDYRYSIEDRLALIGDSLGLHRGTAGIGNSYGSLNFTSFEDGYLVDLARRVGAHFILRGIRSSADYDYEMRMLQVNKALAPEIETVFLAPPADIAAISSSLLKGLVGPEGWESVVGKFAPTPVVHRLLIDHSDLYRRFATLWLRLGGKSEDAAGVYYDLITRYQERHRSYHGVAHLRRVLEVFDLVRSHADEPDLIEFALWFHDVVYDTTRGDNEERSADLAVEAAQKAGLAPQQAGRIRLLAEVTRHDRTDLAGDEALIADIDLEILSADEKTYLGSYEWLLHEEWPHIDAETFNDGRIDFLQSLQQRERIYQSAAFTDREDTVRRNLARAISLRSFSTL